MNNKRDLYKFAVWDNHHGYARSRHIRHSEAVKVAQRENEKFEARFREEYKGGPLLPMPRYSVRRPTLPSDGPSV